MKIEATMKIPVDYCNVYEFSNILKTEIEIDDAVIDKIVLEYRKRKNKEAWDERHK